MNLMELFVKIGVDSSEFDSKLSKLGSAMGTVAKVATKAIAGATTAVTAFAGKSIKAGAEFDSSMSQVEATMGDKAHKMVEYNGETVDSMVALRDFAQQMGATTAFSATQASDALNYMALAGYDATESMAMLPTVLNLASAGGMELATASDMITDTASALGLEMDETAELVDKMATASSNSNTSVSQLGEAMLSIGATAKMMSGGTTELSTALGILADNGTKGAEGGTRLRNILLSLGAPTDTARDALDSLGVSAYDSNGEMKPLQQTLDELNMSMEGMTDAEKTDILNTIFNKTDLGDVNYLLGVEAERWDELSTAIDNSKGSAEKMAETQLDNLAGDVTLFKSALEGVQIAISDMLTPALRDFVQIGGDGLQKVADALKSGDIDGAFIAIGDALGKALTKITQMLPQMLKAGVELLRSLGKGIMQNLPEIIQAVEEIALTIIDALVEFLPDILNAGIEIILQLVDGISETLPELIPAMVEAILQMVDALISNAPMLVEGAIALIQGLYQGILTALPIIIERLPELIQKLLDAVIQSLPMIIDGYIQLVTMIAQHMPEIIAGLIEAIPQIVTSIIEAFLALVDQFAEVGSRFTQFIANGISQAGAFIQTAINNIIAWFQQLPENIAYLLGVAIGHVIKFVSDLIPKAQEIGTNVIQKIITFFAELPSKISLELLRVISKVAEFISNFKNKIVTGIPEIIRQFIGFFTELPSKMLEIGANIVNGIWEGIKSAWNTLIDGVSGLLGSLVKGVKDTLGIASPSKVFKEIGGFMAQGLSVGWDKEFGDVKDSILSDMDFEASALSNNVSPYAVGGAGEFAYNQTININQRIATPDELARAIRLESRYGLMKGVALG